MDMKQSLQAMRRRWYLVGLLLLLTFAGIAYLGHKPGPYQAVSQVVFLASKDASKTSGYNAYLSFGQSLSVTADLVRRDVMDPRTAMQLASQGFTGAYQVADDPATSGPVLDITVIASSKAETEQTLQAVTNEIGVKLNELQANVNQYNKITGLTISFDPTPSLYTSKKVRPLVVVLGLGLVLSIAIPLAVDAAILRRRANGTRGAEAGPLPSNDIDDSTMQFPAARPENGRSDSEPTPQPVRAAD